MKSKKLLSVLVLSAGMLLAACSNSNTPATSNGGTTSSDTPTSEVETPSSETPATSESEKVDLGFTTVVVVATETEGELSVKATSKSDVGTIYYALSEKDETYEAAQIVAGTLEDFVKAGHTDEKSLEVVVTDLVPGKTYYVYFVVAYEGQYSTVVKRSAAAYKTPLNMGSGTEDDPFRIYTLEDLEAVGTGTHPSYDLNFKSTAYYQLAEDIDLSEKYGEDKASWLPLTLGIGGSFDGNGHKVSNLYIHDLTGAANLGLFSQVNTSATLKNLTLENVVIEAKGCSERARTVDDSGNPTSTNAAETVGSYTYSTSPYVGALTGDVKGTIDNCHVVNAKITVDGTRVGGLTGRMYSDEGTATVIRNSSVEAEIEAIGRVGGIAGLVDGKNGANYTQPLIENVTFKGSIKSENKAILDETSQEAEKPVLAIVAAEYAGGIAGYFRSCTIENAFVDAEISAYRHLGGIVGFQQYAGTANAGEHFATISNTLFTGKIQAGENIKNMGPIVGNRSTSNLVADRNQAEIEIKDSFFTASTTFLSGEAAIQFSGLNSNGKFGTSVEAEALNAEWYATNMPGFDFENTFELDDNNLPVLK